MSKFRTSTVPMMPWTKLKYQNICSSFNWELYEIQGQMNRKMGNSQKGKPSWTKWCTTVIPATQQGEAGGS